MKYFFSLVVLLTVCACGSDVDCDPNSFAANINAEVDKVNAAGVDFANEANEDNCQAYLKAAKEYLDAVKDYEDCVEIDQNQFAQQLSQASQLLDIIPCN